MGMISSQNYIRGSLRRYFAGQAAEYNCFMPSMVNREFTLTNRLAEHAEEATRLLGELNAYSAIVPDVEFFISMHIRKEAVQSSKIEGTHTDIDDAILQEEDVSPERRDDWKEVQNYIEALNYSISKLGDFPLATRLLNEAHRILLQGARGNGKRPGEIRDKQNWIGGATIQSAIFVPPHPEFLPQLLSDLEEMWHSRSVAMPKLIRIAVTHYQFETIHPYADGNGRIGRLLIMLQMMNYKLMDKPTLYMSDFFERHRQNYYGALTEVRVNQNLDHWLAFFLDGVIESAKSGKQKFEKIMLLRTTYYDRVMKLGRRADKANKLINNLYRDPVTTAAHTSHVLGISQSNANLLINELVNAKILKEITGFSRNRIFLLDEYVQIFRA
jgi:Fic family protein